VAVAVLVCGFAASMTVAALRYPGGTWCDPGAPRYDVLTSFFCDVLHARGLNGAPNPGAPFARAALLLIAAAFVPFWMLVPETLALSVPRSRVVHTLGVMSAVGALLVALTPSDRLALLHQVAVLSAASFGIAAAVIASSARSVPSGTPRRLRLLSWAALLTAAVDAALYLIQLAHPAPCAPALPVLQKLAAGLILVWMLVTAWASFRAGTPGPQAHASNRVR
jgi:hypothetical protein